MHLLSISSLEKLRSHGAKETSFPSGSNSSLEFLKCPWLQSCNSQSALRRAAIATFLSTLITQPGKPAKLSTYAETILAHWEKAGFSPLIHQLLRNSWSYAYSVIAFLFACFQYGYLNCKINFMWSCPTVPIQLFSLSRENCRVHYRCAECPYANVSSNQSPAVSLA